MKRKLNIWKMKMFYRFVSSKYTQWLPFVTYIRDLIKERARLTCKVMDLNRTIMLKDDHIEALRKELETAFSDQIKPEFNAMLTATDVVIQNVQDFAVKELIYTFRVRTQEMRSLASQRAVMLRMTDDALGQLATRWTREVFKVFEGKLYSKIGGDLGWRP